MLSVFDLLDEHLCTGCLSCMQICPARCIDLEYNPEGFVVPRINAEHCVLCGRCAKACHALDPRGDVPKVGMAALGRNSDLVRKSSSGGVFSQFAEEALAEGYYVYGAAFSGGTHLRHIAICHPDDLRKLQGSKYIQSDVYGCFSDVENHLLKGDRVLFSGTPCQVAGLKRYLLKPYKELVTIDLVRHGVPSPIFWEEHAAEIVHKNEITSPFEISFRVKGRSDKSSFALRFSDGLGRSVRIESHKDLYYSLFLKGLSLRECCYECPYSSLMRPGDITIGDCASCRDHVGLSLFEALSMVLVNNESGRAFVNRFNSGLSYEELDIEREAQLNEQLHSPFVRPEGRSDVYRELNLLTESELRRKYLPELGFKERVQNALKRIISVKTKARLREFERKIFGR